jgi:hypothetical protein
MVPEEFDVASGEPTPRDSGEGTGPADPSGEPRPLPDRRTVLRRLTPLAIGLFALQFIGLCAFAAFLYHRFTLGIDYAAYGQAMKQISHGHLNPYLTILNWPYIDNDFELIAWPLGLLLFVFRSLFFISVVQVACLVGAGFVAWRWIGEMLEARRLPSSTRAAILLGALLLLLLDPTVYFSTALDFHFEAIATLFALLSARRLWRGDTKWALIWAAATLMCGNLGGLYVAGVGVSGLLSGRRNRIPGLVLLVAGVVWIGFIGSIGASHGSLTTEYAYLAGRATLPAGFGAAAALIRGIVVHPGRVVHALTTPTRSHLIVRFLAWGGFAGFFSPWGFGVPVLILLTSGLQHTTLFLGEPFQQRAVVPFVLFGTASLLAAWAETSTARTKAGRPASVSGRQIVLHPGSVAAVGVIVLGVAVFASAQRLPVSVKANAINGFIPASEAATLRHILAQTPSSAEVIVSLPISGRFADHKYLYLYTTASPTPIPVNAKQVVLVLDEAHTLQLASPVQDEAALDYARTHFGARTIGAGLDVEAVEWTARPGQPPLLLP